MLISFPILQTCINLAYTNVYKGDFDLKDKGHSGRRPKLKTKEFKENLSKDSTQ